MPPPRRAAGPSVFVFRRDLRLVDNTALDLLLGGDRGGAFEPAFVVDARQADPARNPYHSARAARFLAESLVDLERALGRPLRVARSIDELLAATRPARVAFNEDHTPFARARDAELRARCAAEGVEVVSSGADYSLVDPRAMAKPYQVFAPFYRRYAPGVEARAAALARPRRAPPPAPATATATACEARLAELCALLGGGAPNAPNAACAAGAGVRGGRGPALAVLARVRAGRFDGYGRAGGGSGGRDDLGANGGEGATTRLSAYVKFGCVSVREAFAAAAARGPALEPLRRQLMFRAFYDQAAFHFPHVLAGQTSGGRTPNAPLRRPRLLPATPERWRSGAEADAAFDAWRRGATGVPIVDAGMRQLEATGFMHNRARMVAASYLVNDLRVDWRRGERHFATRLVDYDPAANSGGWQWAAGCGADAPPPWRVLNPWRQAARFDPLNIFSAAWLQKGQPTRA
jgi:deoxyribodipyrimidine photo-lyase